MRRGRVLSDTKQVCREYIIKEKGTRENVDHPKADALAVISRDQLDLGQASIMNINHVKNSER